MKQLWIFKSPVATGFCWGLLGAIIITTMFFFHGKKPNYPLEIAALLLFMFFVIVPGFSLRLSGKKFKYVKLFFASFIAYMLIVTSMYIFRYYTGTYASGFMWHHFFSLTGIGAIICMVLALVITFVRKIDDNL